MLRFGVFQLADQADLEEIPIGCIAEDAESSDIMLSHQLLDNAIEIPVGYPAVLAVERGDRPSQADGEHGGCHRRSPGSAFADEPLEKGTDHDGHRGPGGQEESRLEVAG